MGKTRLPHATEFRRQMVELARTGKTPTELSRDFGYSAQSIANWVASAASDEGKSLAGKDGSTTAER